MTIARGALSSAAARWSSISRRRTGRFRSKNRNDPSYNAPVQRAARRLPAVLGVTFGLAVTIGNIIGVGILRAPGEIAQRLPNFWPYLAVWVIGGTYALLGANSLAELGAMTARSGGQYVFVRRALGDYAGFVVGWSDWI